MRTGIVVGTLTIGILLGGATGAVAGEKWGPFTGQIVDVETSQGIAGAVVLAIWSKVIPNLAGGNFEFFDAREVVSGADGRFVLPRREPPFFTMNIPAPTFKVFAPGYGEVRWVVTPETGEPLVDPTVVEMRRLRTRAERLRNYEHAAVSTLVPEEAYPMYLDALLQERKSLGFGR